MFTHISKDVWILMIAGALALSVAPLIVFVGGLIGAELATSSSLATLPVASMIVGTACSVMPVTKLMAKLGRKRVFVSGCVYGSIVSLLAALAINKASFWGFTFACFGLGACLAIIAQYRFAAMESVEPSHSSTAASLVLVGGLVAAFVGPELAHLGKDFWEQSFVGSFTLLALVQLLAAATLLLFSGKGETASLKSRGSIRSMREIAKQRVFWVAVLAGAIGYAVMSYIMTATPVSMHHIVGHSLSDTKWVIQSHILAMYLPSFFSGVIIYRVGVRRVMLAGLGIYALCITMALFSQSLVNYWIVLVALGLGWNLLFVSGTTLLSQAHTANERFRVQGTNDLIIFGLQAIAALLSGVIVFDYGWNVLIYSSIPFLVALLGVMVWELPEQKKRTMELQEVPD